MPSFKILSPSEQVAARLREAVLRGVWRQEMPGAPLLANELRVDRKTAEAALRQLELEGLLMPQGVGRRRRIQLPQTGTVPRPLQVRILTGDHSDRGTAYLVELRHSLFEAGHSSTFASKSLVELGMKVPNVARLVGKTEADAWVVVAGSREVLEWFAEQKLPAFAFFGRRSGLPVAGAGPNKPPALAAATRALIELGHRRIVMLVRPRRRLPDPGASERAFLDELRAHGIEPSSYHLLDWEETIEGFEARLDSLFEVTPPSALIIDEAPFLVAVLQYFTKRGLRVPEDVSLICTDADAAFDWCQPSIAHVSWDSLQVVRRAVQWANAVSRGNHDIRQTLTPARLIEGGTIGPARRS